MKPLENLTVLDFSQFLSGPAAAMRLADLGARVIKVERVKTGDMSRQLTLSNLKVDGDSTVFHCMNRNKESFGANLKDPIDLENVKKLISRADVLIENFRPGTMERLGLTTEVLQGLNPGLIYARVTGYGKDGPWVKKPGQDLLVQALSGMTWLNGTSNGKPVPFGLSVVDMFASAHLVQGILALLMERTRTSSGGVVEVSLLETAIDLQFEVLTTYFNDGQRFPNRGSRNNAHAYLGAPYGIYETNDGYVALAMGSIVDLGKLINCDKLTTQYAEPALWFEKRDEIKDIIGERLRTASTDTWIRILEPAGFWCAPVLNMQQFIESPGFQALDVIQELERPNGTYVKTTRCPIWIDGTRLTSSKWAPKLGEDTDRILRELELDQAGSHQKVSPTHDGPENSLPLKGLCVVDFTQFLSGPSATLRLADLGARVIKIEKADVGDISRKLYISDVILDEDSTLFHATNRNKQSIAVDLKNESDLLFVKKLIEKADVVVQNFRPGVIERLGLGYEQVKLINPEIVYGSVTGYGKTGPWKDKPGQDLLVQALSGLPWLNGDKSDPPVPFGLSVIDMMSGAQLVQGILACILRRNITGQGGLVEVSMLDAVVDLQFEVLTAFLNGGQVPTRGAVNNANAYLPAPYGFYRTRDGYLALAMGSVAVIADLIGCTDLCEYNNEDLWFDKRDEIKTILERHFSKQSTHHWLRILESHDIWCAEVLTWDGLCKHAAFEILSVTQMVERGNGTKVRTTRCPFRINGQVIVSNVGAPRLGEHNEVLHTYLSTKV